MKTSLRFAVLALIICGCQYLAMAQKPDGDPPSEINADDFPRTRSLNDDIISGKDIFEFKKEKKPEYRLKRTVPKRQTAKSNPAKPTPNKPTPNKSANKPSGDSKTAETWRQLGVTIWRLTADAKPGVADGEVARVLVQETGKQFTAQRMEADASYKIGDGVRAIPDLYSQLHSALMARRWLAEALTTARPVGRIFQSGSTE